MILVGEVVDILSGYAFKSSLFNVNGIGLPIVRIRDVGKKTSKTFYSGKYKDEYVLKNGDFIIGMDGDFRLAIWHGGKALLNQRVCKISAIEKKVDSKYLFHILPAELKKIEDVTSFATVKHLSVKDIKAIKIPLPPLAEQKQIAAILDAADSLRQKDQQLVEHYTALSQSLFLEMFGDPITNPMEWDELRIDAVCNIVRGSSPRPKGDSRYYGGSVPRLMVADLTRDGKKVIPRIDSLTEQGAKRSRPIKADTVVMAVSGNVGLTSILAVDACIHDGFIAFNNLDTNLINSEFLCDLMMFMKSTHANREAGAIFKNLTTSQIKEMKLPIPPAVLQNQFAERIAIIEQQKQQAQANLQKSEALFNSLLQRAFTGELMTDKAA